MARNITEVRLLNVPLEPDYKHTLYFANAAAQEAYFLSRVQFSNSNFSYQRKDQIIRYPKDYDELVEANCNYVMYKNAAYSNKWYYAFITKMEFVDDGRTNIHIQTDAVQTWMFDYTIKPSFVEREHVNNDAIGAHTVPEGLDTGEYIVDGKITNSDLQAKSIVMGVTLDINNYAGQSGDWNATKEFAPAYGDIYDGLYSGLKYFVITPAQIQTIMKHIAYEKLESAVCALFCAPTNFLELETAGKYATAIKANSSVRVKQWECCDKPTSLDEYVPKNNKLFTAPYCYLLVDNGGGGAVQYFYEKFSTNKVNFAIYSTLAPGMSIRAVPKYYNGITDNDSEGINLSKYATCSWTSDAYTSHLVSNAVNVGITSVGAIAATVGSIAAAVPTGGASLSVAGAVGIGATATGGAAAVAGSVASAYDHLSIPPQLHGNTNIGDVSTAKGDVTFRAYKMSIRSEYAKIIDGYFDMFGYKVNTVHTPLKAHRQNYWYTKTIDVNIDGAIPKEDMQTIKNCYNNGITFWRSPANIGNYSVANAIV